MLDSDFGTFERAFRRVYGAYRLKTRPEELEELTRTYFKVLETSSLEDVLAAGKTCIETSKRFPSVMEWRAHLPEPNRATPTPDQRSLSVVDCHEWHRAERLHWEDEPCACLLCQDAAATAYPLRFVPTFASEDPADLYPLRVFDVVRGRTIVEGHWAHGLELRDWYAARDACLRIAPPIVQGFMLVRGRRLKVYEREPGEEG